VDELTDEVAVVTGAASGIGFALCEAFAAAGMRVVLADVHPAALEAAAERLGGDVLAVPTDVTSWDAVDELEARAVERFGNVHVLCNNAGVQLPGVTWKFTHAEWEWVLGVNWGGVVHGIRSFVPGMVAHGEPGHIVNTASLGGLIAFPGLAPYTAAKHAVVGLSEVLAHDLHAAGSAISVSVLCPGSVHTSLREHSAVLPRPRQESSQGRCLDPQSAIRRQPSANLDARTLARPDSTGATDRRSRSLRKSRRVVRKRRKCRRRSRAQR
jgi:NAD(P)-dependent dehydrogenase (short-subunit alcohol dehydrogenase family)